MSHPVLEVCAFGVQSCVIAQLAGAVRVELCDNPMEGGTTPSYGTIRRVRELVTIQLYPIIRPRALNYFYDEAEWKAVLYDVRMCKQLGCDGISVGVQQQNGMLDAPKMRQLVDVAYPMGVTCNRVIDAVPDVFDCLDLLIDAGCERVLTSGQAATAPQGSALLEALVKRAAGRISIMPGAGVNSSNIVALHHATGATEFHASARMAVANAVAYSNPLVADAGNMFVANEEEVKKMVHLLRNIALPA
jgi:copper homeostasis protein